MSVDTYYTVLGVPETATRAEIKAAYHNLIKQIHPDTISTASPYLRRIAEDKARELTEAYSVLSDTAKRRQYDSQLAELRQQSTPPPPPQQAAARSTTRAQAPPKGQGGFFALRTWARKNPSVAVFLCFLVIPSIIAVLLSSYLFPLIALGLTFLYLWHAKQTNRLSWKATVFVLGLLGMVIYDLGKEGSPTVAQRPMTPSSTSVQTVANQASASKHLVKQAKPQPTTAPKKTRIGLSATKTEGNHPPLTQQESSSDDLAACIPSGACKPLDSDEKTAPPKNNPKPLTVYAIVKSKSAPLEKRCAFLPYDNYGRCNFQPETIVTLRSGDHVQVLSPLTRGENGSDIYKVRTQEGWVGWIDSRHISIESAD